uniref:GST N-terminal domain-containing protein n=1 Tax=Timema bartmani TaxID=61472 RepID=A0A7R9EP05_9NEOP|nr:unnamed protein product [Timema bartmani]
MSGKVLSAGSAQPPLEPGKVRLYGFEYSPYVQRVHMVLIAKNIPYDVKNIDLKNKPDWFLKLNPAGKVPVLDTGDKVLTESLEIVVFLDKNYPGTTLRNTDPEKSAKDKEIVEKFEGLRKELSEAIKNKDYKSAETIAILSLFQSELEKRGTTFLAGSLWSILSRRQSNIKCELLAMSRWESSPPGLTPFHIRGPTRWGRCGSVAQTSTTLLISITPINTLHDPIATAPPPESPAYQTSEYLQPESPCVPPSNGGGYQKIIAVAIIAECLHSSSSTATGVNTNTTTTGIVNNSFSVNLAAFNGDRSHHIGNVHQYRAPDHNRRIVNNYFSINPAAFNGDRSLPPTFGVRRPLPTPTNGRESSSALSSTPPSRR